MAVKLRLTDRNNGAKLWTGDHVIDVSRLMFHLELVDPMRSTSDAKRRRERRLSLFVFSLADGRRQQSAFIYMQMSLLCISVA